MKRHLFHLAPLCGALCSLASPGVAQTVPMVSPSLQALQRVMVLQRELPIEVRLNGKHVLSQTLLTVDDELAFPIESPVAERLRLKDGARSREGKAFILLSDIDSATFQYLPEATRLEIEISPGKLLPQTFVGRTAALPSLTAEPALISHYDWAINKSTNSLSSGSTITGIGFEHVLSFGALRFNQSWAYSRANGTAALTGPSATPSVRRVDSFVQFDQPEETRSWILGDQITPSQGLARSVRSFGLTVRRNFAGRPEIATRPRPSLSGYTVLPTTYELYVDSYRRGMGALEEGLFDFASAVEGMTSGNVRLVLRDSLGRETVVTEPFFFSPAQLAADTSDYALHVGKQRDALTGKRSDYGETIVQAEYGRGISDAWTLRFSAEATPRQWVAAMRTAHSLWGRGSLLADLAQSRTEARGLGSLVNLQLNGRWESLFWGASFQRKTAAFAQIGDPSSVSNVRSKQIATASIGYKPLTNATVSLLATQERRFDNSVLTTWRPTFSYAFNQEHSLSYSASYLNDKGSASRSQFLLWTYRPSETRLNFNSTLNANNDQDALTVGVEQTMDKSSPFRYRVTTSKISGLFPQSSAEVNLGYRGESVDLEFGLRNRDLATYREAQIESKGAGTVVAVKSGIFTSARAFDAAVLVKVGDLKGVKVTGITETTSTNSAGYALLPSAVGFQRNRVTIDGSDIPLEIEYEAAPIEVVPWPKSVVQINTTVAEIEGGSWIVERKGSHIPVATKVLMDGESVFIGKGGVLYLPINAEGKSFKAETPSGERCTISFPERPASVSRSEPLVAQCE